MVSDTSTVDPGTARSTIGHGGGHPTSQWVELDGARVHWVDHGGPPGAPTLVCVHGLGGSYANWASLAPLLTDSHRVLALDLGGFGLTEAGARESSVEGNTELLHLFLQHVVQGPSVLVGNSMGGLIAALQAWRHPGTVAALALVDPALPPLRPVPNPLVLVGFGIYLVPTLGRAVQGVRRRVRAAEQLTMDTLRLCSVDPSRVDPAVIDQHVELARVRLRRREMDEHFSVAARSLVRLLARRRQHARMLRELTVPVLLLHGEGDRLVSVDSARRTARGNPSWRVHIGAAVGHIPMLEAPRWVAGHLGGWLADLARRDRVWAADRSGTG